MGRFEFLEKFVAWKSIFLEKFEPCLKMLVALLHGLKSILNIKFLKVGRFEFLEKFVAWKSIFLEKFEPCLKMLVVLLHGLSSNSNINFLGCVFF